MAKFNEETLTNWTKPPSDSEQNKLENSERMVRDAIRSDEKLKNKSTETFAQGSYANNTNVKLNSDIDINVRYTGGFYYDIPKYKTKNDYNLNNPETYSFTEFKNDVENALVNKFGRSNVKRNDKCITIKENSNRIETDVVPTFNYRRYSDNGSHILGAKFISDKGVAVINYPKEHIQNGINKNNDTARKFKRLTRLHRKLRYKMKEDGIAVSENITSFLMECLVWNIPNPKINHYDTWNERFRQSIIYIHEKTAQQESCNDWGEVSELMYLLKGNRKWSRADVNHYMVQLWNYMEYQN